MGPRELAKFMIYRTPVLGRLLAPKYPYFVNPGQLNALINLIDATREGNGSIMEIGVAKGNTSVFIMEHLRTVGDTRILHLFNTFSGFTDESVNVEVQERGKKLASYDEFKYGDEAIFRKGLNRAGYRNFDTHSGDASLVDWAQYAPIGAMLLDIDVYKPTKAIMEKAWPHIMPGGEIVVDDCMAGTPWDGSLQAYEEFIAEHNLPFERVGQKGAVLRKPLAA